jgi:transposase
LSLGGKIHHIQLKLHTISCEFLSHWDLVAIPRFGLQDMIKRGGGSELGDKQKAILAHLAHCKFLDRFRTTARKRGCDVVEVGQAGSTKNCSHCNSKNSPGFNRFYHCRNCKRKMSHDEGWECSLNIFKMALCVATCMAFFYWRIV